MTPATFPSTAPRTLDDAALQDMISASMFEQTSSDPALLTSPQKAGFVGRYNALSEHARMKDPRRSVDRAVQQSKPLEPLRQVSGDSSQSERAKAGGCMGMLQSCIQRICSFTSPMTQKSIVRASDKEKPPPRKWYRLHPEPAGEKYFVRPDAGLRGRIPGVPQEMPLHGLDDAQKEQPDVQMVKSRMKGRLKRCQTVPPSAERKMGLANLPGFESGNDSLRSICRVCYENPIEVVLLPCRHGALCEECLRRALISRPAHRAGRQCPLCRTKITEVVWIYGDAAIPQYGFTIKTL